MHNTGTPSTIFFDGECNLCSGSVQFILQRDDKATFQFASLQGQSGQDFLAKHNFPRDHFDSFILVEDDKLYTRSTAALRVAKQLHFPWQWLYAFIIVPPFVRDSIYEFVSKNRYKWFGKKEACWIPDPRWTKRFLP